VGKNNITPMPQIEVESKFHLTPEQEKELIKGAELVKERSFTDVYFDDAKYTLTLQDKWLRQRAGEWELKMPVESMPNIAGSVSRHYQELVNGQAIALALGVAFDADLTATLKQRGIVPFASFTTLRRSYMKKGFRIDLDTLDFDYTVAEIEILVENQSEVESAKEKIKAFAEAHHLDTSPVHGKLIEYIKRLRPAHAEALIAAGLQTA